MTSAEENIALIRLVQSIDLNLSGIAFPIDERATLAVGCFDVALEHQAAIASLYQHELFGSMFALLRVLTEAVVRGLWILHVATGVELNQFKNGKLDKPLGVLIKEVECALSATTPALSNLKATLYQAMNGFTHTGFNQVSQRHGAGTLGPNYSEVELAQAQCVAAALGLIAAGAMAELALTNRPALIDATLQQMRDYSERTR